MTTLTRNLLNDVLTSTNTSDHQFHKSRLKSLLDFVEAGIEAETITLTQLGRAVAGEGKEKSRIKRADRLIGNDHLFCESEEYYRRLSASVIAPKAEVFLLVDWSTVQDKVWYLLRASLAVEGRAITVFEQLYPKALYNSDGAHKRFLKDLKRILPKGCKPTLVSDAGFKVPWFQAVEKLGWNWLGRVRGTVSVRACGEEEWFCSAVLRDEAQEGFGYELGPMELAKSNPLACRMVMINKPPKGREAKNKDGSKKQSSASKKAAESANEAWMLATNREELSLRQMFHAYYTRMQIEEDFRDDKSATLGMGFELSRSNSKLRLTNLMIIVSLINYALTMVGITAEEHGLHRDFQANTISSRRVLSFFYLGRRVVKRATYFMPSLDVVIEAFERVAQRAARVIFG